MTNEGFETALKIKLLQSMFDWISLWLFYYHPFLKTIKSLSSKIYVGKVVKQISGYICIYHPAAPGSNPKHIIYAFSICNWIACDKYGNKQKETEIGPYLKKLTR